MRLALRLLALVIAVHGVLFALGALTSTLGEAAFWLLVAPALMLAMPLTPLLWPLHLMEAPGWFAWPKPLGFVLVYFTWVVALLAASFIFRGRA